METTEINDQNKENQIEKENLVNKPSNRYEWFSVKNIFIFLGVVTLVWLLASNQRNIRIVAETANQAHDTAVIANQRVNQTIDEVNEYITINDSVNYVQNTVINNHESQITATNKQINNVSWTVNNKLKNDLANVMKRLEKSEKFADSVRRSSFVPQDTTTVTEDAEEELIEGEEELEEGEELEGEEELEEEEL